MARYSRNLYEGLKAYCDVDLIQIKYDESAQGYNKVHQAMLSFQALKSCTRIADKRYDAVHSLDPIIGAFIPFITQNSMVTFHDLVPLSLKGVWRFEPAIQAYFKLIYLAAARSKLITTNSSQTKSEMIDLLRTSPDKIHVINHAVDDKFKPQVKNNSVHKTLGFIGNFGYRKRIDIAIEVYKRLRSNNVDCKLVLAAGEKAEPSRTKFDIQALTGGDDGITIRNFVPEDEMVQLYNSFDILLVTSETEGFGLPILEAQRCGVPVLVRNEASIPAEVTEAAVKCDASDGLVCEATNLFIDPAYFQQVSGKGIAYSSKFTWENVVQQTIDVYKRISDR